MGLLGACVQCCSVLLSSFSSHAPFLLPPTFLRLCTYTLLPTITPIASPSFRTLYLCSMQYCIAVVASDLGSSHCTCTCNLHLHRSSRLPRSGGLHVNETRLLEALPPVERGQICCGTLSFLFLLSSSLHPLSQVIRTVCTVIPIQSSVLFSPSASWLSPSFPPGPSQHPVSRSILRHLLNLRQLFFLSIFPIPINPPGDPPQ